MRVFPGWWVVLTAAAGLSLSIGTILNYTFGVLAKPLAREFGADRGSVAVAIAVMNIMVAFSSPIAGRLVDRFGGRRVISASILALSCCLFGLSFVQPGLWRLYALYALAGILGAGTAPVPYGRVVANWFDRSRGLALGLASTGLGFGAFLTPNATQAVIDQAGWMQAYMSLAGALILLALPLIALFLKDRPEEYGLLPDGEAAVRDRNVPLPQSGATAATALWSPRFWQ